MFKLTAAAADTKAVPPRIRIRLAVADALLLTLGGFAAVAVARDGSSAPAAAPDAETNPLAVHDRERGSALDRARAGAGLTSLHG